MVSEELLEVLALSEHATAIYQTEDIIIKFANDAMIAFWGKDRSVIGMTFEEAIPELKGQPFNEYLKEVWRTGISYRANNTPAQLLINGVSCTLYFDFEYRAIKNADGEIFAILHTANEVTEKVKADNDLKKLNTELTAANETIHNIILQAPVAMALFKGENMIIEEINDTFLEIWDRDRNVVGLPVIEALPEMIGQPYPQIMKNVYDSGETFFANEARVFLKRQGKLHEGYYNFINQPFRNNEGNTIGIVVTANEVTEQVNARQDLEHVYEQAKLSKEAAEMGTFDLNLQNGIMEWDERCRILFGISHQNEVVYEKDFVGGLHPDDRERVLNIIAASMDKKATDGHYDVEYRTIGEDDRKLRWVRAKGRVYFTPEEKPYRFIGSVLDITEQKLNEIRKNDFIGMVSHELKTPLTSLSAILQVADMKLKNSPDTFIAGAMKKAIVQVKRMGSMVNGFLNISRLESSDIVLDKSAFDLEQLAQEMIEEAALTVTSHIIELERCDPVMIKADREKISSVITNLISNAVKYSPKGKRVKLRCKLVGGEVIVTVEDEGMGIKEEEIARIFDRYYRVEATQMQHTSGFGIGLYLSAEIVRRHNGRIWVESELGNGSKFHFSLPI